MKKLANRIILITLAPMLGTLILFIMISWNLSKSTIQTLSTNLILESVSSWAEEFESFFEKKELVIDTMKAYIESSLSLDELADAEAFGRKIDNYLEIYSPVVKDLSLFNLYAWFAPEYASESLMEFSIRNTNLDGELSYVTDSTYTRADMEGSSWSWFTIPEKKGSVITDPYEWAGYDSLLISYVKSLSVEGETVGVIGSDMFISALNDQLLSESFMKRGHYALLSSDLVFLAHPSRQGERWEEVMPEEADSTSAILRDISQKRGILKAGNQEIGFQRMDHGWILLAIPDMKELYSSLRTLSAVFAVVSAFAVIIVLMFSLILARNISRPVIYISRFIGRVAKGDLTEALEENIDRRQDEIGKLGASLKDMMIQFSEVIRNVHSSSENVGQGALQLSHSSQQLSQGATHQASSTEEISSSMEQLSANIEQNLTSAQNADERVRRVFNDAEEGGRAVTRSVDAIKVIAEKIQVIDEIASSTNMLALNAAIEAARAGESGKGFAVVASEVRKLAESSQKAAAEITEIAVESVEVSEKAGTLINSIIPEIKATTQLVQEIFSSSREQSSGAEEVNRAMQELDKIIQQNAAASEEVASMAEELSGQAEFMKNTVDFFKLKNGSRYLISED